MITLLLLASATTVLADPKPTDREALTGLTTARVIFDVKITDLDKLVFNLRLFGETLDGMVSQGVKPEMVVAFRGPGIKYLTAAAIDEEVLDLIRALRRKGVRFEACAVAMRTYKADPTGLVPEVKLVANGFNSLIGYQNKGYAMIAPN
jgi:intracellular sulfur oxidation DsrE/DsrF family protein